MFRVPADVHMGGDRIVASSSVSNSLPRTVGDVTLPILLNYRDIIFPETIRNRSRVSFTIETYENWAQIRPLKLFMIPMTNQVRESTPSVGEATFFQLCAYRDFLLTETLLQERAFLIDDALDWVNRDHFSLYLWIYWFFLKPPTAQ